MSRSKSALTLKVCKLIVTGTPHVLLARALRAGWVLLLTALSACGGGGTATSPATPPSTPQPAAPAGPGATPVPSGPAAPAPDRPGTPGAPSGGDDAPAAPAPPPRDVPASNALALKQDALRFLNQSTFGATAADLAHLEAVGYEAFLNEQFATPPTGYHGFNYLSTSAPAECRTDPNAKGTPENLCARDNYSLFEVQRQFYANAIAGRDQLRQRVAFALSQILVVSGTEITHAAAMASYQNLLLEHAFENYRELLEAVTLSPVMGVYLDVVNNAKGNPVKNTLPNENFARECLQLFSLGLQELNLDGTPRTDAAGEPIATYDQPVVSAFARVFTGWTFAPLAGATSQWPNPSNLVVPMVPIDEQHDSDGKVLLNGIALPAGQSAQQDLRAALDAISHHPNVGPFIARRLIQHLVTSNPRPAYIARVAAVFNDNGHGSRGDLQAVVRAILLDDDARGLRAADADFGRLRDPALFMTAFIRGMGGQSDGVYLRSQSSLMGENVFSAPSVFNFYSPNNRIRGTQLLGPEFGIYDGNRALLRAEFLYPLIYGGGVAAASTVANSTGTSVDLTALAARSSEELLDALEVRLAGAHLSTAARAAIRAAIGTAATPNSLSRTRMATYLTGVSPEFQVQQ